MNNNEVINLLPKAKARHEFMLKWSSEMWLVGVDNAVRDSAIIDWVTKYTGFLKYAQKETEVKAGIYNKPFLHRMAWRIRHGYLPKRIKRKVRRFVRKVYPLSG